MQAAMMIELPSMEVQIVMSAVSSKMGYQCCTLDISKGIKLTCEVGAR